MSKVQILKIHNKLILAKFFIILFEKVQTTSLAWIHTKKITISSLLHIHFHCYCTLFFLIFNLFSYFYDTSIMILRHNLFWKENTKVKLCYIRVSLTKKPNSKYFVKNTNSTYKNHSSNSYSFRNLRLIIFSPFWVRIFDRIST